MSANDTATAWYIADPALYPDSSHHRDAIEAHFEVDSARIDKPLRGLANAKDIVFVCFSNRSGSNLLLDALGRIGFGTEAGDEFFNAEAITDYVKEFMFADFEQYLQHLLRIRGFRDCVFLKIGPHQLFWMANRGILSRYFRHARYILVERRDQIAQAVSLFIAETTGTYLRTAERGERPQPEQDVAYSKEGVLKCLKHVTDVGALFRYFFTLHSISFHQMWYEEIDTDPVVALTEMARELSLEARFPPYWQPALRSQSAGIVRQANAVNARLIAQFKRDFAIEHRTTKPRSGRRE